MKILVIGAGIFGCTISLELDKNGYRVTLVDSSNEILSKATKNNHNRIHYGYHYPRSIKTAKQSLDGLTSFVMNYKECIVSDFPNYYAISNNGSRLTTDEYKEFCDEVGIMYKQSYPNETFLNPNYVDSCFKVDEPVYDINILTKIISSKLKQSKVKIKLNEKVTKKMTTSFDFIINCTYSNINDINEMLDIETINFKKQLVIIPVVLGNFKKIGLTIMDGNFCSVMPKGFDTNHFLLYHVKHSVVQENIINESINLKREMQILYDDCVKYYPFIKHTRIVDCYKTVRSIPINYNDERLSKVLTYSNKNVISVFSGKVTTCVKIAKQIVHGLETGNFSKNIIV